MKVLIAYDSPIVYERLTGMVSNLKGIETIGHAHNASEAINIKKEHPDTVVIILTNYTYPQYRQRCMDEEADFFFDKSTESNEVTEVLKRLAHA